VTPQERTRQQKIAAHISWGKTPDRTARTAPARQGLTDRFLKQVPPEITDPDARLLAAESLRKAFYIQLAHKSAVARKAKAAARKSGGA
jgi:hypothetical protein